MTTYGVLGVGSIAEAIVVGLCTGDDPPAVVLSPRNADRAAALAGRFGTARVARDNQEVVDASDVVLVCLRLADTDAALAELAFRPDQTVVSAVPGMTVARLGELAAPAHGIVRSIPMPAVAGRESATVVHPGSPGATTLFDRLGGTLVVDDEVAFESVSVASATVAAHLRYLATVADWLRERGIPEAVARRYVADTFAAVGEELRRPDVDFAALAAEHATPGGLNEQLERDLAGAGVYDAVRAGLDVVLARIASG